MKVGIDKISFYVPKYYLDMTELAKIRNVDPLKYQKGLLINKMAVTPLNQDIVSMAVNAAFNVVAETDKKDIDLVLFATETGIDFSKAASTHLISLLNLSNEVRAVEIKQACYSVTAAIYLAKNHILQNPDKKALIVGADIARYGINTGGEPTQGAGAVALILSANPRVLELEGKSAIYADDIYDFWRPNDHDFALVDGHYSNEQYKKFFLTTYEEFLTKNNLTLNDLSAVIMHTPYAKIGLKSLNLIANHNDNQELFDNFEHQVKYNKEVGNIYTGSLYLSLISLLENGNLKAGDKIGLYSYGSGAVGEFYLGVLAKNYKEHLFKEVHNKTLNNRKALDANAYEELIMTTILNDVEFPKDDVYAQLKEIKEYKREYSTNK